MACLFYNIQINSNYINRYRVKIESSSYIPPSPSNSMDKITVNILFFQVFYYVDKDIILYNLYMYYTYTHTTF